MDFKVVFKDSFIEDLGRIVRLIAAQNPSAAQDLGESIIQGAESLSFSNRNAGRENNAARLQSLAMREEVSKKRLQKS